MFKGIAPFVIASILFLAACASSGADKITAAQAALTPVFQASVQLRSIGAIADGEWLEMKRLAVVVNERLVEWSIDPENSELEKAFQAALSVYNMFRAGATQ